MDKHLIDLDDFSIPKISKIIWLAEAIMNKREEYATHCRGKVMATLFYEPSTRTQMSFQTAMLHLGGQIIGFDNPDNSSVAKGEILKDTIRVISNYADIITIRHPKAGAAKAASMFSRSPVINAGDGGHLHPTQTLTDIFTLTQTKHRLDNLTIGFCGDLLNGRTVHSLIKTMVRYPKNRFVLISTPNLKIPDYIKDILKTRDCEYKESTNLANSIPELDVLYMTRIQRERFASNVEYNTQKGIYILDSEKLKNAKEDLKILHPLPRVDEITLDVDDDDRAVYFDQTEYGMFVRMALIVIMLEKFNRAHPKTIIPNTEKKCKHTNCITTQETYLPSLFKEDTCEYCENMI